MKFLADRLARPFLMLLAACALALGGAARAQGEAPVFKPEEIEALVAPIALYPDALLTQVLMASTYPLEVVQAARWQKENPKLKGDEAVKAVADKPWDVSVKSLVAFPQVLEPMNEKIDWTQKLGDAFLADQKGVLDAVQRLRAKAQASGNLKTTEQQKVAVEQQSGQSVIVIEPASPQVIYVPAYNPTVVYGAWAYPTYPPYYWPPPAAYYPYGWGAGGLGFGLAWGFAAGAIYGGANWGGGDINIDIDRATNIDRNFDRTKVEAGGRGGNRGSWQHDASHRKGVTYRDNASREKFGKDVPGRDARNDFRGRDGGVGGDRGGAGVADRGGAGVADRGGAGVADRGGAGDRGVGDRGGAADRGGAGAGSRPAAGVADRGGVSTGDRGGVGAGGRDNAFQGVGSGASAQRDFDRGRASSQSMASNRGSAGARSGSYGGSRPSAGGGSRPSGGGAARGGGGRGGRR
jgi:hypothetical protein